MQNEEVQLMMESEHVQSVMQNVQVQSIMEKEAGKQSLIEDKTGSENHVLKGSQQEFKNKKQYKVTKEKGEEIEKEEDSDYSLKVS
ncbi:hypothetical protein QVD17_08943 [Tagetes erecta]|uniref:Uncharacterized protein n=1 Tax=Tagetes erecta TaxID=13708 RepID=A0AAD8L0N0_TARER|nr:hypothetical protein QVD17_08943 [Tagetes erecta]